MNLQIDHNLSLQNVTKEDHNILNELMLEIYPPEYAHYWKDGGEWYIDDQYSKENLMRELSEPDQAFYFVVYADEIIGIIRLIFNCSNMSLLNKKTSKLHRIYLHQKVQGKGIGKQLLDVIESLAREKGSQFLWLEVMQKQTQAVNFYLNNGYDIIDSYNYDKALLHTEYQPMYSVYKALN